MLLVAVKRHSAQGYRLGSAEKGARCIGRDAKSGIPHANIGLHVEVWVVVSEREREIGIRHQRSPETVRPPMFESIDVTDVIAIFANVDRSVDGRPKLRFIGGVDLIALELPRENLRVGPVVISKLEVSTNSQGIYRAQRKPRENHVFGDGQVHASRAGGGRVEIRNRAVRIQGAASGKRARSGWNCA